MTFSKLYSQMTTRDKRKMLLLLGLLLLLAFMATSIAGFFVSKETIRTSIVKSELPLTSDTIYSEIQKDLMKPLFVSSTMANDTFLRDWVIDGERDLEKIRRYLAEIRKEYGTITSFFVSEKSRTYYYYDGILKTVRDDVERDHWYFRVRAMRPSYEINVDPDMANRDAMTIFINYRVFDYNGNFIGATGVGLTVGMVKNLINDYQRRFNRNVYFLDKDGNIVLHNDFCGSEKVNGRNIRQMPGLESIADRITGHEESSLSYEHEGKTFLVNTRYIPELGWHLLVEQAEDITLKPLRNVLRINLLICLAVTVAMLLFVNGTISWFQRRLENRCKELEEKNREIEEQRGQLERQTASLADTNRALEQLHREKDEWIGIIIHDLKSPLISIAGFSRLLIDNDLNAEERRESTQYILKSTTAMTHLVNTLLDVYTFENAQQPSHEQVDLCSLVAAEIDAALPQAQLKKIEIRAELPTAPAAMTGDPAWLVKIIDNLVSNAIKFSPEHTTINVRLEKRQDRWLLTVCDQGPGLTAEDHARVFTRFGKLSAMPTGGESSTGLGLYFVRKITERMGGTVRCESTPGRGACFFVELPAAIPPG